MKNFILYALCLFSFSLFSQEEYLIKSLKVLEVNSSINPATYNYLSTHITENAPDGHMVLIKMDTPGGLVTTTKDIITLIGKVNYPIGIWITPEGASATSAGAIIASSAHILMMSAGTNIGAATPVQMGKDIEKQSDGRAKAINDLVALVSSLSKSRGRNAKRFSEMIEKASSFDAETALKENIIDGITNTQVDFINSLKDREVVVLGKKLKLNPHANLEIQTADMDPGQKILDIFANPMTAYILFVIGAALLYLEFQAPGGFIAGAIGVVCLILAAIGFQVLPLNIGALGLIVLSFVLFILEIYITSYGILSLGGVLSLIFGSLFLFRTENAYLDIQLPMVLSVAGAIIIYIFLIGFVIMRNRGDKTKFFTNEDAFGHISKALGKDGENFIYQVKVNGEIWKAETDLEFSENEKVKVLSQDDNHMKIMISKLS